MATVKIRRCDIDLLVCELQRIPHGDLGWVAGIMDGEGTINIWVRSTKGRKVRTAGWQVRAVIGNNDPRVINKLAELFVCLTPRIHVRQETSKRAQSYQWIVASRAALIFLKVIQPFLVSKAEQAKIAIELQERITQAVGLHLSKRDCNSGKLIGGPHISPAEEQERLSLHARLRRLNVLGPERSKVFRELMGGTYVQ